MGAFRRTKSTPPRSERPKLPLSLAGGGTGGEGRKATAEDRLALIPDESRDRAVADLFRRGGCETALENKSTRPPQLDTFSSSSSSSSSSSHSTSRSSDSFYPPVRTDAFAASPARKHAANDRYSTVHSVLACYGGTRDRDELEDAAYEPSNGIDSASSLTRSSSTDGDAATAVYTKTLRAFAKSRGDVEDIGRACIRSARKTATVVSPVTAFFVSFPHGCFVKRCPSSVRKLIWEKMYAVCFVDPFLRVPADGSVDSARLAAFGALMERIRTNVPPAHVYTRPMFLTDRGAVEEMVREAGSWFSVPESLVPRPDVRAMRECNGVFALLAMRLRLRWMHPMVVVDGHMEHPAPVYGVGFFKSGSCVELPFTETDFSMILCRLNDDAVPPIKLGGIYQFLERNRPVRCLLPAPFQHSSVGRYDAWDERNVAKWAAVGVDEMYVTMPASSRSGTASPAGAGGAGGKKEQTAGDGDADQEEWIVKTRVRETSGEEEDVIVIDMRKKFYFAIVHKPYLVPLVMGTYAAPTEKTIATA